MGIPVIATTEIRRFSRDHGDVVEVVRLRSVRGGDPPIAWHHAAASSTGGPKSQSGNWNGESRPWASSLMTIEKRAESDHGWDRALRRICAHARGGVEIIIGVVGPICCCSGAGLVAPPSHTAVGPPAALTPSSSSRAAWESGQAGGAQERLGQAVTLYRAGYAPYMVLSSGYVYSFKEAESMRDLAIAQGVPVGAIVLEEHATNTYENVVFSNAILKDHHSRSILLVSSPYHMRRATMVWHKLAPEITVTPAPPPRSQFYDHTRGA